MSMRPVMILLLAATLSLNLAFSLAPSENPAGCLDCHSKILDQEHKHPPAEKKCEICHKANGKTHPVEGVKGFTLVEDIPSLCYECHDPKNDKKNVHSPVANGKCLSCHEVHSSANESMLKYPKATLCQECHDIDMTGKKSQHKAVTDGNCMACHDAHQSDFKKLIKSDNAKLCLNCHEKEKGLMGEKSVHPPFSKNCLICHTGHNSDTLHLLKEKTPDLCFGCHDDIQAASQEARHPHPPVTTEKNCMNCHSPHASAEKKLLLAEETKTCLTCHNKSVSSINKPIQNIRKIVLNSKYFHGGTSNTGCSACHLPHGSSNPFILNGSYPEGIYTSANKESFLVCFTCHKSELLLQQTTANSTGFRNGTQNLHFLHIYNSKSRTCFSCHNVHGALNPQLIADKVRFGKWEMPIRFVPQSTGGTCAPGCHSEKTYKR